MNIRDITLTHEAIFKCRIYFIFSAVVFQCLYLNVALSQEIDSYRTITNGNFENISTWQVYDGTTWVAASTKPNQTNDIYIDQTHLLTLTGNEEVKSIFINADSGAEEKLNINGYNIDVYGTLQAFEGAAPGSPTGSFPSTDWIGNSISSTLTFKGSSRVIIPDGGWSGQSTNSRYAVIFDPNEGAELVSYESFKALKFTIRSGIVLQKINGSDCATFSYNIHGDFGDEEYGDFIIENGGKLVTECNSNIMYRTGTSSNPRPASLFHLQAGGEITLEGTNPRIEAVNFQLDGTVTFSKNSGSQSFLAKTYTSSSEPLIFHNLNNQGSRNIVVPPEITITGSITQSSSGAFLTGNTHIILSGPHHQSIEGFSLQTQDLTVNKSGGKVYLEQDLNISRNLTMNDGTLDFQNNHLSIKSSGTGNYSYSGGSWENLSSFSYSNVPSPLTSTNGTFPFGDRHHGGIRKLQILGTNNGGNVTIDYTEYNGADYNPGFNDSDMDSTPILYRLFSYFNFSGFNTSSDVIELRIAANNLIVDNPDDLRLVCTGYAAPGNHLPGIDIAELWARRNLTVDDLVGKNFTVGSSTTLSILPVTWLDLTASIKESKVQINWSVAQEKDNEKFEIYHSINPLKKWDKVGEIFSKGDSDIPQQYIFTDINTSILGSSYYQIRQVDYSGKWSWSRVVRLNNSHLKSDEEFTIFPNPHSYGKINVQMPEEFHLEKSQVNIYASQGLLISSFNFDQITFSENLEKLKPGLYLIIFSTSEHAHQLRWIKQ